MTKLIPSVQGAADRHKVYLQRKIDRAIRDKKEPDRLWENLPVYQFGDQANGYYILYDTKRNCIRYFVAYTLIKSQEIHFGRQVFVWSDRSILSAGFARDMFWNVLLPRYGALIADTQQTDEGQAFWKNRLDDLFRGYVPEAYAYIFNKRITPISIVPLLTRTDVQDNEEVLWGHDRGHLRTHAVISLKPLTLRTK